MTTTQLDTQDLEQAHIAGFTSALYEDARSEEEPALLRDKRDEAFRAYLEIPTPTARTEEWRRTDPASFPFGKVSCLPRLGKSRVYANHDWDEQFDVVVSVTEQGFEVFDRAGALDEKTLYVGSLDEAAVVRPDLVGPYLQGQALPVETNKFTALNSAFWNVGLFVHLAPKARLKGGVLIRHCYTTPDIAVIPRLLVVAGDLSEGSIVEHFETPDAVRVSAVACKELYIGQGGRLKFTSLQDWGDSSFYISNDMARVERDARVDWITMNFGSRVSKMNLGSDVAGENSAAELDGLYFADREQHVDQRTLQVHSSPNTYSRLLYKGAVKDRGHSVYQGVIQAKPGAIKVDAYQTNNNLVLTDGARADTIPGLLIDADDLKCSHGATIGNLDPEQLFYLRVRGLSEQDARRIVILGFFDEVLNRISNECVRERAYEIILRKLGEENS